jgi:hypothetical protein
MRRNPQSQFSCPSGDLNLFVLSVLVSAVFDDIPVLLLALYRATSVRRPRFGVRGHVRAFEAVTYRRHPNLVLLKTSASGEHLKS